MHGRGAALGRTCPTDPASAPPDHGIVFRRTDLVPPVDLPALAESVNETTMASTLCRGDGAERVRVQTVEHLMSALAGLGIDNLLVEVTASEIPILDGSAASFVYLIQSAGIVEQPALKRFIRVLRPIQVGDDTSGRGSIRTSASSCRSRSNSAIRPSIPRHSGSRSISARPLMSARWRGHALGFISEVEMLRDRGLAKGGSLGNAIVMDETRVLNNEGLRSGDEFVKHKILDAIGDLYVIGAPLLAAYSAYKSGHALNNELIRALLADTGAWTWATFHKKRESPRMFIDDWSTAA
ncbi:MAG: UDP-3-O-acyl-N-acetylglucosamine deacetylase [Burkholderiaceae bacterium]